MSRKVIVKVVSGKSKIKDPHVTLDEKEVTSMTTCNFCSHHIVQSLRKKNPINKGRENFNSCILLLWLHPIRSIGQDCIDTIHLNGYFVGKWYARELSPRVIKEKDSIIIVEQSVDIHYQETFTPTWKL